MKTFFVTGGAGFIGSAFVRLVLDELPSCEVVNFDALTYAGNPDNLSGFESGRHRFIRGDITERTAVLGAVDDDVEAIINFAAESHVDRSISSAHEFINTNVLGTQVLLDVARERGVRRFVRPGSLRGTLPLPSTREGSGHALPAGFSGPVYLPAGDSRTSRAE